MTKLLPECQKGGTEAPKWPQHSDPAKPKGAKKKGPAAEGVALKIKTKQPEPNTPAETKVLCAIADGRREAAANVKKNMSTDILKPASQHIFQQRELTNENQTTKIQQTNQPIRILPSHQASNQEARNCQRGRRQGRSLNINGVYVITEPNVPKLGSRVDLLPAHLQTCPIKKGHPKVFGDICLSEKHRIS